VANGLLVYHKWKFLMLNFKSVYKFKEAFEIKNYKSKLIDTKKVKLNKKNEFISHFLLKDKKD